MSVPVDEAIAHHLRAHQTGLVDWPLAPLAGELHRWVEVFDAEFKLDLPSYPVLQFAALRKSRLASYAWFRNEVGTKDNITFNIRHLVRRPVDLLGTLLHELLHLWQHYSGAPGKRNYHNKEFRDKAAACGITVTPEGCNVAYTGVFFETVANHGIDVEPFMEVARRLNMPQQQPTKMKKWTCNCTTVRCATKLQATCSRCGRTFDRT